MTDFREYSELYHHGIKGQKWGIRRYQNKDGKLTMLGKMRIRQLNDAFARNQYHRDRYNEIESQKDRQYDPSERTKVGFLLDRDLNSSFLEQDFHRSEFERTQKKVNKLLKKIADHDIYLTLPTSKRRSISSLGYGGNRVKVTGIFQQFGINPDKHRY